MGLNFSITLPSSSLSQCHLYANHWVIWYCPNLNNFPSHATVSFKRVIGNEMRTLRSSSSSFAFIGDSCSEKRWFTNPVQLYRYQYPTLSGFKSKSLCFSIYLDVLNGANTFLNLGNGSPGHWLIPFLIHTYTFTNAISGATDLSG